MKLIVVSSSSSYDNKINYIQKKYNNKYFMNRVTQIKTYSWDNAQVILVGNKCDMEEERVVSQERGRQLAEQLGVEFYETSAKENINVKVYLLIYILCFYIENIVITSFSLR